MATMSGSLREEIPPRSAAMDAASVMAVLEDLQGRGLDIAVHVAGQLMWALAGDPVAIRQTAAALTPAQRRGHRTLPAQLPLTPCVAELFADLRLGHRQFDVLLLAALATDDSVEHLATAAGLPAERLSAVAGAHLVVARGRFALADPRLAVWLRAESTPSQRADLHARLQRVHDERDQAIHAAWHRARAAMRAQPDLAAPLIAIAEELMREGRTDWAYRVAVEAADHAAGALRHRTRLIAGTAALASGCIEDAAVWLRSAVPGLTGEQRVQALAGLFVADAHLFGAIPAPDPREYDLPVGDTMSAAWARAAGIAAVLCAERGTRSALRGWLAEVRTADAGGRASGAVREPTVALCGLLASEPADGGDPAGARGLGEALRRAVTGDMDAAQELAAQTDAALREQQDALTPGLERAPLNAGYRVLVETLLLFWNGQVARARDLLLTAAVELPLALPFAGLGAVLARRLDVAVLGRCGPVAHALTYAVPAGTRIDRLVDQSLEAYLAGRAEDAAIGMRLWIDRGAPGHVLAVPGLDEVGPLHVPAEAGPPELAAARSLLHSIRRSTESAWPHEHLRFAERARGIRSPFTRGRVEAALGAAYVIHGDRTAGRRHLRAARSLFDDAGADAWRAAVDVRLARLGEQREATPGPSIAPIPAVGAADPLAACRAAWEAVLTDRELEVAMLIVAGAANRQVGEILGVSVRTVEVHASRIFAKLGVRSRVELTVLAHRTGQYA